jgi:arabinofuranan 3-O-arabinosyltransferase
VRATDEFEPAQMSFTTSGTNGSSSAHPTSAAVEASLVRKDPATMRIRVGERSQESVLAVAQNFNEGWTAHDDKGAVLPSIRLDGWKQGWVMPPGAATVVIARFAPEGPYRGGLLLGLVALLCAAATVPLTRPRRSGFAVYQVPGEATVPAAVAVSCAGVALVFMSGWAGVVVVVVVSGVLVLVGSPVLRRIRVPVRIPALVLVLGLGAGVLAAAQPWGRGSAGLNSLMVQSLTLLAFTLACVAAFRDESPLGTSSGGGETSKRRSWRPRRMIGRSTKR